jgi:hypothetical protein
MFAIIVSTCMKYSIQETLALLVCMTVMFNLCHYEAYFTGNINLGMLFNPTEAQLMIISFLLITYSYGKSFSHRSLSQKQGTSFWIQNIEVPIIGEIPLNRFLLDLACLACVYGLYDA